MQPNGCIMCFEMDAAFKALADESRRKLLDELFKNNGQTLGELCEHLDMTRQAVTKHLLLLEAALSQASAVARDLRALDWQIRTPSPSGVEQLEKGSRRKQKQERLTTCKIPSRFIRHSSAPRRKNCGRPSPNPNS